MVRHRSGRTFRNRHKRTDRPASCGHEAWIINLLRWMNKHNYRGTQSLVPANFKDTGRGLQTRLSIQPGDTLISLPASILITTDTVLNSEIGHHIKTWTPKLIPQQCIAIFLIWEKGKGDKSSWKPYLDSLPESFNTPAYFTTKELNFLPNCLRTKAQIECQKVKEKFLEIRTHVKHHWASFYDMLDWDIFLWAWYVINSRSVYYKRNKNMYLSEKEEDNIALAPLLDLLNHSPNAKITAGFDPATNCYQIITHDTYKPFDQVFISYGCHGNKHLALEYGFCVPDNCHDDVHIEYDNVIDACRYFECVMIEEKVELLRENNMLKSLSCCSDGLTWNFWLVLKTFAMKYKRLQKWHTIFMDTEELSEEVVTAKSIAKYLLQAYLQRNLEQTAYIGKNMTDMESKDHVNLCISLLVEERKILKTSLHNLDQSNFW